MLPLGGVLEIHGMIVKYPIKEIRADTNWIELEKHLNHFLKNCPIAILFTVIAFNPSASAKLTINPLRASVKYYPPSCLGNQ